MERPSRTNQESRASAAIGLGSRYYAPKASSMTPMERFMVLSPENETFALPARVAMDRAGVSVGSLEMLDVRHEAATTLAAEVQHGRVSDTTAKL